MASVDLTKLFSRCLQLKNGKEITLYQCVVGDVGCVVWDAAIVLCSYLVKCDAAAAACSTPEHLLHTDHVDFRGKTVLDLGSGTGAVGLVAASLGATVVVTDLSEFVPLMQYNIDKNKSSLTGTCSAKSLEWGEKEQMHAIKETDFPHGTDFIMLADCVYYEESLEHLVQTILYFSSTKTNIFCSYEERDMGNKPELQHRFFEMMAKYFDVSEVPLSSQDEDYRSLDIHVLKFVLKDHVSLV